MTEVRVRELVLSDLPKLEKIDHNFKTNYVWQLDIISDENEVSVKLREIRLPREMNVTYPKKLEMLSDNWQLKANVLVAEIERETVGYMILNHDFNPGLIRVTDLVVTPEFRRKGVGCALLEGGEVWAGMQTGINRIMLEFQSKNYPAVCLVGKLGFEFCGYNDKYYHTNDVALFFMKHI